MENQEDKARQYYSVSFAEEQTNFVKASPHDVRDVIRLLKYWKKTENVPVRSYFLELLVIHMWQKKWQRTSKRSGYTMVVEVVNELTNIKEMKITWPDRYISTEYSPLPEKPVLLDPLNPYNNVAPFVNKLNDIVEKSRPLLLKIRKYLPTDHAMPKQDNEYTTVLEIPELDEDSWVDNDETTWEKADNSCGCIII
ncbi:2'-5'-oligoadenylate synthase 2-like [Gigantopelta aegis]|uniref:2'-5'-oligoadenylate synthase 2-like n=1 Tax=Gigantopelta aegis TaxID=1735272 RepID=UPI001B88C85E|nr:2'-5'-oligoadenylate synthase 2-like [Gigantopelta aegis]